MSEDVKVSTVDEIASAEATRLVPLKLAKKKDGSPVVVRVKAVKPQRIIQALKGIPAEGGGKQPSDLTLDEVESLLDAAEKPYREVARMVLIEPPFAFDGPEEGKADWNNLMQRDQAHIVQAAMALSGLKDGDPEDAEFSSFPSRES